jgi:hypothetical protein
MIFGRQLFNPDPEILTFLQKKEQFLLDYFIMLFQVSTCIVLGYFNFFGPLKL